MTEKCYKQVSPRKFEQAASSVCPGDHSTQTTAGEMIMSSMEEIEMERHRKALEKDVVSLVNKYIKTMEWDIPEADEPKARQLILDEIKQSIARIESRT
jgi:hypothetical protein